MDRPIEAGSIRTTRRAILLKAAESMPPDEPPAGLKPPVQLSQLGAVLLGFFDELNLQRPRNGLDICPLDPGLILAWQKLRQVSLTQFEVTALIALDLALRKVMSDDRSGKDRDRGGRQDG
ncbi:MAG: hypothetical protein JNM76_14590 [Betaproteobacteria bacterium]|nr:hypothetical protein [Betaproteobacteria bacterium]